MGATRVRLNEKVVDGLIETGLREIRETYARNCWRPFGEGVTKNKYTDPEITLYTYRDTITGDELDLFEKFFRVKEIIYGKEVAGLQLVIGLRGLNLRE
jgi:hypothetical protein